MSHSVLQRMDAFSRQLVPCASIMAFTIIGVVPLHIPRFDSVAPSLPLIAVFYWTLYRPELIPVWAVFVLGIVQDALSGLPVGVTACTLTVAHAIVVAQRRFLIGKSFSIIWLSFALVVLATVALGWALVCAYYGAILASPAIFFQAMATIGVYPILSRLLSGFQIALLRQF
jgi:rod shape-determining protein MreD